jgi:hypothetical protein
MSTIRGQMVRETRRLLNTPTPQLVATSTTQALSAALGYAEIMLSVSTDSYIREDTDAALTATPVSSANGHFVPSGSVWALIVNPANKIGVIAVTGTGAMHISAIS